jgi:triose/dihydroxyacetone kinase / FAD-AMP lyase (cyclizing)
LRAARRLEGSASPSAMDWAEAFRSAVKGVSELGGAQPGDRTMLDALDPASLRFREQIAAGKSLREAWSAAVDAAREGAAKTADMMPRAGRASYLGARAIGHRDAGAAAVVCWMEALLR